MLEHHHINNNNNDNFNENGQSSKMNNFINTNNINDAQLTFNIVTHNVQGLNSYTKQLQIIDTMNTNNIDIMGLAETKLSPNASTFIYKKNPKYKGKWYPPEIDNPAYKGPWAPRKIPNPEYFEDLHPSNFEKIVSRI